MIMGFDSSNPTPEQIGQLPTGTNVGGYIGGKTPHVWTDAQWLAVKLRGCWPVPIHVAGGGLTGHANGADWGNGAVASMQRAGLTGSVVLDVELFPLPDLDWLHGFIDACTEGDTGVALYCSRSSLPSLYTNDFEGVWLADYTMMDPMPAGYPIIGVQYAAGGLWDLSLWDPDMEVASFV